MSIFNRKSKNIAEIDKELTGKESVSEEHTEQKEFVIRVIVDGKLYDTSKAEKVCTVQVTIHEIPDCKLCVGSIFGEKVTIYKGNTEYFITYCSYLQPVDEEWVKRWLGKQNIEKYIELFGEPELA